MGLARVQRSCLTEMAMPGLQSLLVIQPDTPKLIQKIWGVREHNFQLGTHIEPPK